MSKATTTADFFPCPKCPTEHLAIKRTRNVVGGINRVRACGKCGKCGKRVETVERVGK